MEFRREELLGKGFNQVRLNDETYLGLSLEDGSFLIAKQLEENLYGMHGARDVYEKDYSSEDLSGFDFDELSLEQFFNFVRNPERKERVA